MAIGPHSESIRRILDQGADGVMERLMQAYRTSNKDEFVAALAFELVLRIRAGNQPAVNSGD